MLDRALYEKDEAENGTRESFDAGSPLSVMSDEGGAREARPAARPMRTPVEQGATQVAGQAAGGAPAAKAPLPAAPEPAVAPAEAAEIKPAATVAAPSPAPAAAAPRKTWRKKLVLTLAFLGAVAGGAYYGHDYWTEGRFLVSTDDAYVSVDMAILSPKITGYVESVNVSENDVVRKGDALVTIDDGDYRLALEAAEAKIATQKASIDRVLSQKAAAQAQIAEAVAEKTSQEALLGQADLDFARAANLVKSGVGTSAQRDNAQSARASAAAKVAGADATIAAAEASVAVFDAQGKEAERLVRELEITRDKAARDLTFTALRAPYDGVVGNLAVQPGDYVSPGRRLAAVVPLSKVFIDANFKETQVGDILPGQKVEVEIDALPGRTIEGTVTSISPASGSVFSLLPTDNATGNFTKVVQRIPVRIEIDNAADFAGRIRPGLSVFAAIDIRTGPAAGGGADRAAAAAAPPSAGEHVAASGSAAPN